MLYFRKLFAIASIVLAISTLSKSSGTEDSSNTNEVDTLAMQLEHLNNLGGPSTSGSNSSNTNEVDNLATQFELMNNLQEMQEVDDDIRNIQNALINGYLNANEEERKRCIKQVQRTWKIFPKGFRRQLESTMNLDRNGVPKKKKKK
ncbi:uncharacterized protein LOC116350137 isoform X2 [Contarinia nasturtii]|uniref:uncharacterized protein LOC116350137 isoform X2 n=1 Tax=Contarinia nasturtii TaxID=265458 RepID=UPI0012D3F9FD|nr:uncharacterized protein LOC116350137 isoform X2 [Contarinia nasturtii]